MAAKKSAPRKRVGKNGPKPDSVIAKAAKLSRDWRDDAEATMLALQEELRKRIAAGQLDTLELIGAYRVIGETLTTARALTPDAPVTPPPSPAPAAPPPSPAEDPAEP